MGRRRRTWTEKLISFLSGQQGFSSLPEIYAAVGAQTVGSQACIRGIIYRNLKHGDHLFKREGIRARYAITAVVRKCWLYFNRIF